MQQGKDAEAEALFRETLAAQKRVLGDEHPNSLLTAANLAITLMQQGKDAEAEALCRETHAAQKRVLGDEHPNTLHTAGHLASSLMQQGKDAEAEVLYRAVCATKKRVLGDEHPDTLGTATNLASSLMQQGKDAEAEVLYREVRAAQKRVLGDEHPDTLRTAGHLASTLMQQGKTESGLYFAGEATSATDMQMTHGAMETGICAAKEILSDLFNVGRMPNPGGALPETGDEVQETQVMASGRPKRVHPIRKDVERVCERLKQNGGDGDTELTSLQLSQSISTDGFKLLAKSLEKNVHLRELYLVGVGLNHDGMEALTESLKHNRVLSSLNLGENTMTAATVGLLVRLLEVSPAINALYLDWGVTNSDVKRQIGQLLDPREREGLWIATEGSLPEHAKERPGHHAGKWTSTSDSESARGAKRCHVSTGARPKLQRAADEPALEITPKRRRVQVAALPKLRYRHPEKRYSCQQCDKRFSDKTQLTNHVHTHTGEKPHGCAFCSVGFANKCNTRRHERTVHAGKQPGGKHICRYCSRRCWTSTKLVQHERTHSGDQPYACKVCCKRFSRKDYRKIHEDTHRGIPCRTPAHQRESKRWLQPHQNKNEPLDMNRPRRAQTATPPPPPPRKKSATLCP